MVRNFHENTPTNAIDKGARGSPPFPPRAQNPFVNSGYEVPPRFRRQFAKTGTTGKPEVRIGNRSNNSSTSPPQFRRKTGRSPINFEDFLPPEHRSSPSATPKSDKASEASGNDDSGIELPDDLSEFDSAPATKFETPPRFQKPAGQKELQEGVTTASGKFVPVGRKPQKLPKSRGGARPVSYLQNAFVAAAGGAVPVLLPGAPAPGPFFAGPPALQLYHPGAIPAYVYAPGMDIYEQALHEQQLAAMYGMVPDLMRAMGEGAPKQKAKEAKKPMKSSENTFKYVYKPPPDEPAQAYATGNEEPEFKFPNRRNRTEKKVENESVMEFSWEKFLSELSSDKPDASSSSFLAEVADDSSSSSLSGTATPDTASPGPAPAEDAPIVETLAVPVFAKSPPASEVPLPPIDWLSS